MTSVTPETGEPVTTPDSVADENQTQNGQTKLDGQAEESREDTGQSEPNGKVEGDQAINEQPDLVDLEDEKNGADQLTAQPNGSQRPKSRAGKKEAKLIELSDSDSRADEKESVNGRAAEAIPA